MKQVALNDGACQGGPHTRYEVFGNALGCDSTTKDISAPATPEGDAISREPGDTVWHSSDGESGPDVGITVFLANGDCLYAGELPHEASITWGIALYPADGDRIDIAHRADPEAAREMIEAISQAIRSLPPQDGERELIERLTAERDEADRRAGAAERGWEADRDTLAIYSRVRDQMKEQRGFDRHVSFDKVWADTCAKADRTEKAEAALALAHGALDAIEELNKTGADENGHRWDHSDLISQEILMARGAFPSSAALTAQPVAQEPVAGTPITMTYRNYRGEIDRRTVVPTRIWFGSTDWHPEPGWLMSAYDLAKAAHRDFALADCQFAYLAHPATPAPVEAGMRDWFSDCRVLMANLDAMISHTGEAPEDEDGFMVDEIREAIALRAQSSPVVPVTPPPMSQAALDVFAERQRQISAEGWTPEHDDDHDEGELAAAAATYALSAAECIDSQYFETWPWAKSWWKPTTTRRDLVKAGALILAEMERLDRAAPVGGEGGGK